MTGQADNFRQAAVLERRHWVRLTRACNNRCLFCLDSGAQDGRVVPEEAVRERILEGRRAGAERLILSGGEPTIHPKYLDFIRLGTEAGYTWIQTVTNGRMFRYGRFAEAAVRHGLREATFSMHGHTPDLHDRLVAHEGAFAQALAGLRRVMGLGVVVSVDVVLNRLNLPFLREILDFYVGLGVREFDLLHLVPFGRGWDEHRDLLFPEDDLLGRELERALRAVDGQDVVVWTNRLPIQYLEGREDLFQDPHKIYDEVLGEREAFRDLFERGIQPPCLGPRCPHCFLRLFCEAARRYEAGGWDGGPDDAAEWTRQRCAEVLARGTLALGTRVRLATRETLQEAREVTPDLADIRRVQELGVVVTGLPPCLGGPASGVEDWPPPDPDVIGPDGRIVLARFVAFFIRRLYRVKSLRCRACRHDATCPGLHVNTARCWGLRVLTPLPL